MRLTLFTIGTINGIIFYANAAKIGMTEAMVYNYGLSNHMWAKMIVAILAWINLDQGFSNMFLQTNDTAYKNSLSLAFPSIPASTSWCTDHLPAIGSVSVTCGYTHRVNPG